MIGITNYKCECYNADCSRISLCEFRISKFALMIRLTGCLLVRQPASQPTSKPALNDKRNTLNYLDWYNILLIEFTFIFVRCPPPRTKNNFVRYQNRTNTLKTKLSFAQPLLQRPPPPPHRDPIRYDPGSAARWNRVSRPCEI